MATELRRITIPVGSRVTVERADGSRATYVFRGTDPDGAIFEDEHGQRHQSPGEYVRRRIDNGPWE